MSIKEQSSSALERGSGEALWKQIATELQNDIKTDAYSKNGQRLPTEQVLTARFQVNRHTVRRAIHSLVEDGLVRTEQGRGVFVNTEVVEYPLGRRVRFSESLSARQKSPKGKILSIIRGNTPIDAREALGLKNDQRTWRVDRLGFSDETAIALSSHYFCAARFPKLKTVFNETSSITSALNALGVADYERKETRILARPATAEETRLLELPRGRPVLITEGINIDTEGAAIEYSISRFAADRVQLVT